MLTANPAKYADKPKPSPHRTEDTWTPQELAQFLRAVRNHRLSGLWRIYALTGLRRSEALALLWDDIDFRNGSLSVSRSLQSNPDLGGLRFSETTKSGRSRRVALDPQTLTDMRTHRTAQESELKTAGDLWQSYGLVFSTEIGEPYHPDSITRMFQRLRKAAGLRRVRLHDLRHGHATDLLRSNVHLKTVSSRLGHSSVAITGDLYIHAVEELDREAATAVANLIDRAGGSA